MLDGSLKTLGNKSKMPRAQRQNKMPTMEDNCQIEVMNQTCPWEDETSHQDSKDSLLGGEETQDSRNKQLWPWGQKKWVWAKTRELNSNLRLDPVQDDKHISVFFCCFLHFSRHRIEVEKNPLVKQTAELSRVNASTTSAQWPYLSF